MNEPITTESQGIVVYKINPAQRELSGDISFDENVHGKILTGNFSICDHALVVADDSGKVIGVFSLHHFYFIKSQNM